MLRAVVLAAVASLCSCDEQRHRYEPGERVKVWANKVGPFNNPLETYEYFTYPLCPPNEHQWVEKFPSLGEALQGDKLVEHSNIPLTFRKDSEGTVCTQQVTKDEAGVLRDAVSQHYWYQYYIDDLPVWATIGKVVSGQPSVYLHQNFSIGYQGDRIVVANLSVDHLTPVPANGGSLAFTYTVHWVGSQVTYEKRWRRYLDNHFFEHKVHWFSIFNSFMMFLFLTGIVMTILNKTLKADYQRYAPKDDIEEDEFTDESGWKQVHGDVFRVPPSVCLLCALIGTGWQLIAMALAVLFISIGSMIYSSRGALLTYCVVSWALTSVVAGYSSGALFQFYSAIEKRSGWIRTMLYTACLFPGTCVVSVLLMNFIAWGYHSSQAIPFLTMMVMLLIWGVISFPLVVVGTVIGRNRPGGVPKDLPRVTSPARSIPPRPWFLQRTVLVIAGGVIPFGSIFIECYFVFTSFWNYKFYYVYGFTLLSLIMLVVITMCVSVVSTYILLNAEDHRWQWTSFNVGASTSWYIFGYACYFFFTRTKMSGLLQTALYFGYMGLFCYGVGVLVGCVSFAASYVFVRHIYRVIKLD